MRVRRGTKPVTRRESSIEGGHADEGNKRGRSRESYELREASW